MRGSNLDKAAADAARARQAAMRRELQAGVADVAEVLAEPGFRRWHVPRLVAMHPSVRLVARRSGGVSRASAIAEEVCATAGVSPWREAGRLTDRQRTAIADAIAAL